MNHKPTAMNSPETSPMIEKLEQEFRVLLKQGDHLPEWFNEIRQNAFDVFKMTGFPAKKDENYKYTYLEPHITPSYQIPAHPVTIKIDEKEIFKCDVPELNTNLVLLINGFFYGKERLKKLSSGVIWGSLNEAILKYPDLVEAQYGKHLSQMNDPMAELNLAMSQDGFFIYLPDNTEMDAPIQIINIALNEDEQFISTHNLIIVGQNSHVKLVLCDHSLSPQRFIMNSASEVVAGKNARIEFSKLQNSHNHSVQVSSVSVSQDEGSNVISNYITLHGGIIRNNLLVNLNGKGAVNDASGLYIADKMQHIDNFVQIQHQSPECHSTQLYKGILDDISMGVFSGKILVAKDAQKTQAFQTNKNILLTSDAKVRTKPQLEIYADDVKCSHGATVGQIDEEALFYLRSRGIDNKEARLMLLHAFAHEVMKKISIDPLRDRYDELVNKRLRGELSRCNNCAVNCG
jgi:Fe-S cluster assembly protein SufD